MTSTTLSPEPGRGSSPNDEALSEQDDESDRIRRLRAGDERAWEELIRETGGRMLSTARRMLPCEDDARNAVQAAFVRALKGIESFRGGSTLATWLYRITVNEALMHLRSRSRRPETAIEELQPHFSDGGLHAAPVGAWPDPDTALLREETRTRVQEAIAELPVDYRVVLLLRDIEEVETAEVAEMLGITAQAVRMRLHRARCALRSLLTPMMTGAASGLA